jgi:ribosomal-protein-alanine N-acetyltransferase
MAAAVQLVRYEEGGDVASLVPGPAAARTIAVLTSVPRPAPWGCYLALAGDELIGACAFKAAPDDEGTVEIAYHSFPPQEGRGYATAMIAQLIAIACGSGAAVVIAHTAPVMNASACALCRNGFVQADAFVDPEDGPVWYWERVLECPDDRHGRRARGRL